MMNMLGLVVITSIVGVVLAIFVVSNMSSDVENEDVLIQLAENHKNQAQLYENQARELTRNGHYKEAIEKFVLSAEEYQVTAQSYVKLNDFFNAAKYNGRASIAYEESYVIYLESIDLLRPGLD